MGIKFRLILAFGNIVILFGLLGSYLFTINRTLQRDLERIDQTFETTITVETRETQEAHSAAIGNMLARNEKVGRLIFIMTIAGLVVAGGIVHFTVRTITQPLGTLKEAVKSISEGNLDTRVDIETSDEVGVLGIFVNNLVSDLNGTFVQLEWTLNHMRAIIDNLVDGVLVTNRSGEIVLVNPALLKMFNLKEGNLLGQMCYEIFNNQMPTLINKSLQQPEKFFEAEIALDHDGIGKAVATAILRRSHEEVVANTTATYDDLGAVILVRDITVEKEIDRMKTDFISTVSHELRTPLTSVLGFAKIIKKRLEEIILPQVDMENRKTARAVKQVKSNVDIIVSEGERLTALINDVLDIAKMEAGKIEWEMRSLAIIEIIDWSAAATAALFEQSGLELIIEIEPELPQITGDRDRLIQVMINLISNAVKFTDEGSVICRAKRQNGAIQISISDTGRGIAQVDQPKVFERFKQVGDTLTDKPKGTGLGLPICKQIVEHHRGRIWVESQPGQGSTFSFTLPIQPQFNNGDYVEELRGAFKQPIDIDTLVKELEAQGVTPLPLPLKGSKTILVVDDDSNIRELLRQELETKGYLVHEAKDGLEAIAQAKKLKLDLITLDVMMPQIDGFDVAAVLKSDPQTAKIPIIILSIMQDKARGYRLGVDSYLNKPIDAETLLGEVETLLSRGPSTKKVLVVDEDVSTLNTLSKILQAQGYNVTELIGPEELVETAKAVKPDMIIFNTLRSEENRDVVKALRFEKGLENVLIFFFQ